MCEVQKPTKWERVKNHFRENRKVYLAGGVCLVAGAVLGYSLKVEGDDVKMEALGDINFGELEKTTPQYHEQRDDGKHGWLHA